MTRPTSIASRHGRAARVAAGSLGHYAPAVEVMRGTIVESIHAAAIAVADSTGRLIARLGSVDHPVFLRSSAKPFQAMAVVESGAVDRFGVTARELALMTGSHNSEAIHVETASGLLARLGLDASALQCGTHTPFSRSVAEEYRRTGRPFTALENNCSGKHAGMLAAALALDADTASYLDPAHPVQRRILGLLADLTGRVRDRIAVAVDGCGAPTFAVTLSEAARAFARLVSPDGLAPGRREAATAVVSAMRSQPEMIGGTGTLDSELCALPRHGLIAKRGAEGVQCAGFLRAGAGIGIAAKIGDGDNGRARVVLLLEVLRQLGVLEEHELPRFTEAADRVLRTHRGREVGVARPAFTLVDA